MGEYVCAKTFSDGLTYAYTTHGTFSRNLRDAARHTRDSAAAAIKEGRNACGHKGVRAIGFDAAVKRMLP